jgi:hypothetical protein
MPADERRDAGKVILNHIDRTAVEKRIHSQASGRTVKFTLHAHQEMLEEDVSSAELLSCLVSCELIETYPDHKRGACCLVCGKAFTGRVLHVVCTCDLPELVVITVYEPKPPKWDTPYKRGQRS